MPAFKSLGIPGDHARRRVNTVGVIVPPRSGERLPWPSDGEPIAMLRVTKCEHSGGDVLALDSAARCNGEGVRLTRQLAGTPNVVCGTTVSKSSGTAVCHADAPGEVGAGHAPILSLRGMAGAGKNVNDVDGNARSCSGLEDGDGRVRARQRAADEYETQEKLPTETRPLAGPSGTSSVSVHSRDGTSGAERRRCGARCGQLTANASQIAAARRHRPNSSSRSACAHAFRVKSIAVSTQCNEANAC